MDPSIELICTGGGRGGRAWQLGVCQIDHVVCDQLTKQHEVSSRLGAGLDCICY